MHVPIIRLPHGADLPLPCYETYGAAAMDIRAALAEHTEIIAPGGRATIPCGICIAVPDGYEAQVRPRSGLAAKYGITILNTPGTIDSDYRGEIKVILRNTGSEPFMVRHADRVAQLLIAPVTRAELHEMMPEDFGRLVTKRGSGGFGSTGTI